MMTTTPGSLLERLRRPGDLDAWEHFVRLYTPLLHSWARHKLGLNVPDAADLVQDVFTVLVQLLPEFRYDPHKRFRGWLWTVTLNAARAAPPPAGAGSSGYPRAPVTAGRARCR
jgi:RNA polymerase sigma-70 factor (ECF subfamily)